MEPRKIMALGKSSRVISLPKSWLKRNNLDRGDRVSLIIRRDGTMVVHPTLDAKEDIRKIHINVEADESLSSIIRRIIGAYLNGYTLIKLLSKKNFNVDQQKAIRRIASTLYMMIIESEASSIMLEALIDESRASLFSGVERMHLITYSMCRDILVSMKNWDEGLARSVISLEDDVDQLMYFLLRLIRGAAFSPSLANQLGIDPLDCLDFQTLVHRIERIADHITNITTSVIALFESEKDIPEFLMSILIEAAENSLNSYNMAVQSFFSNDLSNINDIIDEEKNIEKLFKKITPIPRISDESHLESHMISIRESIKKICHYAADIAELTIDHAYESQNSHKHRVKHT